MDFMKTELDGAYLIRPELLSDERGFFARTYCKDEFTEHGITNGPVQCNISFNTTQGTVRGMHFQYPPYGEAKLVRCTAGSIFDVIIDLRHNSPTFKRWIGYNLSADNRYSLYIPEGFAHGFQTLTNDCEVFYQMFSMYTPNSSGGVRWNDPVFSISWPLDVSCISDKDAAYPDFSGFSL